VGTLHINSIQPSSGRRAISWLQSASIEVWLKFLLALVGLGVAFGAALFSTAAGEAGNPLASVILASLSLLMAAFVGLVTVPYLARRVALERLRETLHYEVTKAGVVYVLVTVVIGIAALNTGNNLLYIIVAAMLAAILVSGIASAIVLRGLHLDVRLPEQVFAGRTLLGRVVLNNPRRFLPAFSIRVITGRDKSNKKAIKRWRWERTTFTFPPNRTPENQWLRMRDWKVRRLDVRPPAPGIFEGMIYFPYLPPKTALHADLQLQFSRRGRYCEAKFALATQFPFAFLTKIRDIALAREILVYPAIQPADALSHVLPLLRGEWESFMRGRGSDLHRIREYMPEDSARHVDWKATAKSGSLKVREFSREDERRLRIIFDNPIAGLLAESAYERAVSLAASLAWSLSLQDAQLSFAITGQEPIADVNEFLARLAVIEGQQFENGSEWEEAGGSEQYSIIVTSRSRENFSPMLSHSSYFVHVRD
jgi:uncharacterized protein (DUF58 family)